MFLPLLLGQRYSDPNTRRSAEIDEFACYCHRASFACSSAVIFGLAVCIQFGVCFCIHRVRDYETKAFCKYAYLTRI